MNSRITYILFLVYITLNAQTTHRFIKDDEGHALLCNRILFLNADGNKKNIKCTAHEGCYIQRPCTGIETILIYPEDESYYEVEYEYPCDSNGIKISSKSVVNTMQDKAKIYHDSGDKFKALLYYKNLAYTYNRNGNKQKALETEQKSYFILSQFLLNNNGDSLVKIENNELIVETELKGAIKKYQTQKNLKIKNGEFTYELAKSFKGNDSLFYKDKVFEN